MHTTQTQSERDLKIEYVPLASLTSPEYNPRIWDAETTTQLKESISRYGVVDPLLVNSADNRKNIIIGGNFRAKVLRELGHKTVPVVYIHIADLEREKELCLRLNKNHGEWDLDLLATFDESLLADIGFNSEDLDEIFEEDGDEEQFDLNKELEKLNIDNITVQKGDVYALNGSRLMCGDSTIESDILKLCGREKADMVLTDPPYRLDYLKGKTRHGKPTEGFGTKKNRKYLETDELPENFTDLWMTNAHKVSNENSSIICYENWKNIREIWSTMEKFWKVRNMIVWHLPNRNQGYAGRHKFFSKHDIAMVGTAGVADMDLEPENDELLQNEYTAALFAIQGKPHWESYEKGKKYCPTDFIDLNAADEKSSGQEIIFGVKPIEILIPYIKVLTKRDQIILEPFCGSGSTLIAATKIKRRCLIMEKSPVYAEVALNRWEKMSGKKRVKIDEKQG